MTKCNNSLLPSGNKFCTSFCDLAPTKPNTLLHVDIFSSDVSMTFKALQNANKSSDTHLLFYLQYSFYFFHKMANLNVYRKKFTHI